MARNLSGATDSEKDKRSTTPLNILQIDWGGAAGTKYYADRTLSSPVTAEGRVIDWGNVFSEIVEDSGHISDFSVSLQDKDRALLGIIRSQEAAHKIVYFYQFFSGLSWSTDKVLLMKGTIKDVSWDEATPALNISVENIESKFTKKIETKATIDIFPSIKKENEGKILPLVYGDVERSEVVQVVDSKRTTLALPCSATATEAIVTDSRDWLQGIGNLYDVYIGRELTRGYFDGAKFKFVQREKVITTGKTTHNQPNGRTFRANLTPAGPSWIGFKIRFFSGTHKTEREITNFVSPDVYGLDAYTIVPAGRYFEIYGERKDHDAGVDVTEKIDKYTWIINDAPSTSLKKVEIEGSIQLAGEGRSNKVKNLNTWLTLDERYYDFDLNDSTWSGTLGHNVSTISMVFDPRALTNTPYVGDIKPSFRGIDYNNPVDILKDAAVRLGLSYPGDFNTASESSVRSSVSWLSLGFFSWDGKGIDFLFEIAVQSRIGISWEGGLLTFRYLENKAGTSVLTITNVQREQDSYKIDQQDPRETVNKIVAKFRDRGIWREIVAEDSASISKYGENKEEITLWAHNNRAYAESIASFWLRRWANIADQAQVTTFLTSLELERYDWITLNDGTLFSSQPAEVLGIDAAPGDGEKGEIDRISLSLRLPRFAGCSSSCELYEETGCASTCQQCCQSTDETSCGSYTCETAAQDACSLTCVSVCELECTTYYQMSGGCSKSCETGCTNQCESSCTAGGCQGSCTASCTASCQTNACEASCVVACEAGTCQLQCESTSQTACSESCEFWTTTCYTACETGCEGSCTAGCTAQACQTGGCETSGCQGSCEATSCTACCETTCTSTCQNACEVGSCQTGCTSDCQLSGCEGTCTASCESNCQGKCEGSCQDCGEQTGYTCANFCQTAGCMQHCESSTQNDGWIGDCATSCQAHCMTASETGCGGYCTVGCECYCQAQCEAACMTGTCQTNCQCECQTSTQPTPCSTSTEGACYSTCQGYAETGCNTGCQTGCQDACQLGCQDGCELYCTTGCRCNCQNYCEAACRTGCETICRCQCQTSGLEVNYSSCPTACQGWCMTMNEGRYEICATSCQVGACMTGCQAFCESTCTTSGCITACQNWCQLGGCMAGCQLYCTTGCRCDCQTYCQISCRSGGCEENCQCLCQTACQTGAQVP